MTTIDHGIQSFSTAAIRATAHLLNQLTADDQERIARATENGASLEMVHVFIRGETAVRLDLVDTAGARHNVVTVASRMPTMQ